MTEYQTHEAHVATLETEIVRLRAINAKLRKSIQAPVQPDTKLKQAARQTLEALTGMLAIVDDSQAVAGYHLNGELETWEGFPEVEEARVAITTLREALKHQIPAPVTLLPDGSAFAVMSYPLPKTHWLYAPREYEDGADKPKELPSPILTHTQRDAVVAAVRYAIRGATGLGKDMDFDPDALVQNAVYALCGPYKRAFRKPLP